MNSPYGNYIGGNWRSPTEARPNINPSNLTDTVGEFAQGSTADVDEAVAAAQVAFPAWSRAIPYTRSQILAKAAAELASRAQELGIMLAREEGKTLAEAVGEVNRAAQIFDFFAGEAIRISGETIASLRPDVTVEITREPIGIVGIITPWNFPMGIPAWKIAAALAYGNCVVFKPADLVPASGHALTDILIRAGIPAGVLNLVMGRGRVIGQRIIEHRDIHAISFTGSSSTGRMIAAGAVGGETMKKIQLEMGGKSPLVVLDDADIENAVECALDGAFLGTGQRCTASSRLVVTDGIHDRFVAALKDRLAGIVVDDALKPGTHIGPVVDQGQFEQDLSYIESARSDGARLVSGGEALKRDHDGYYLSPALFVDASPDMRFCREEIFGPVAGVIRVKDYDEALAIANDTAFGLSSGICTTSLKYANDFKRNSDAGMVKVNLSTSGVDFHVPFGGRKASSYGPREQGRYALEFFTQVKTSYQLPL
ncbi:aldehyde dehydrogenase family protein [Sphingobium sp. SCG-1]|uniref:aldehyde dehydrogenase family protein n=1 Tax=Sphingobium sp. SCG-1 TaxID=2072936 RepID=UPI000CD6981B|nr:aldehyde dehydrogenase family protein [Sphingobium sp. SCG-1]AUW59660.1 aldehyde dehydrogenase family protein [Sphingobium sp. SCG-1]